MLRKVSALVLLSVALVLALAFLWPHDPRMGAALPDEPPLPAEVETPSSAQLAGIRDLVMRSLGDGSKIESSAAALHEGPLLAHVTLRARGKRLAEAWHGPARAEVALGGALEQAKRSLGKERLGKVTEVQIDLAHSFEEVDPARGAPGNVHRGIRGLEVRRGGEVLRYAPTEMIATNRSFERQLEMLGKGRKRAWIEEGWKVRTFEAHQVLVSLGKNPTAVSMFRGNQLVPQQQVTRENVAAMAGRMETFMARSVQEDGRMRYAYFPSRGQESRSNNMIRQWMATVCLGRVARDRGDPELVDLVSRNIRYNLQQFYSMEGELGLIEHQNKVKLGAVALAALAIVEHPKRADFAREEKALRRTVEHLWNEDGSFRTFYKPPQRNDIQNFYPGEALLLWAMLYAESEDARLLDKIMKSYRHYRGWHLKNRNPAFIPWHTQAYFVVWQQTRDPELRDWIFEMNDWLLPIQQNKGVPYPDMAGRFYDPTRPFGPPHASSTGVYLEGLVDAYALAKGVGDEARASEYRRSILLGLRSVMQLEFADDLDMFYVSRRREVRGGVRTNPYDNVIRVDNVQHNLMAIQKILETFGARDFGH